MSFEQWNMLIQTAVLAGTMAVQVIAVTVAYYQFKRFKRDRITRILDKFAERRKTTVADERGRRATLEAILREEIG